MDLTEDDVFFIMKTFNSSDYETLDLRIKDFHIQISKSGKMPGADMGSNQPAAVAQTTPVPAQQPDPAPAAQPAPAQESASATPISSPAPASAEGLVQVSSPMIGTFYRSPSPGAPAFVEVGDTVKAGDPLCLIEVMKTYSTISAEVAGRIVQICVPDSTMVQDNEPLFLIEPDA